ncbi:response regulator receiver protein [Gloeothece citriformis PCC 7424]|uniref:Response regulator receiver protein n=1 Tax=Gloeothece citriformis (strain PCC 7424) TaxID=65393 RepID=B7KDT5_GLOC7|nr:response regulator [Gloeothece citriformis]ACK70387.1 response regulator receiver protein [Gloeothece citriformis PCC 7424]
MKFLIVDDSNLDRHLLSSLLQELGHETEVHSDTDGLLDKLSQGNYKALFLDIVMPNQDGYKFLRTLRANPSTANQIVVFCSSKKTVLEINYGIKKAGADEYLVKPVSKESLTEVLQKIST